MNNLELLKMASTMTKASYEQAFLKNIELTDLQGVTYDPYKKSFIAYVCISSTAKAISQIPLIVQERKDGVWERVDDSDPWQAVFKRPNHLMSSYSFVEAIVSHLLLDGNAWVLPFPPTAKVPDSLWVVKKRNVEPIKDSNSGNLIGWYYKPEMGGPKIPLSLAEMAQVKFFNPDDYIFGQAPLEAGKLPLQSHYRSAVYNDRFFEEGAVPGVVLTAEKSLGDAQFKRILAQFESRHKGFRKHGRTALIEGGVKLDKVGLTQKDMDFVNLRDQTRDEILQIFGMKKIVLSIAHDINYATAREQRKEWWQDTNLPIMRLISESINFIFFRKRTDRRVAFDIAYIEVLEDEIGKKIEMAKALHTMGVPFNTINDKLNLGFPKLDWGDIGFMPMGMVPVGQLSIAPQEPVRQLQEPEEKLLLPKAEAIKEVEVIDDYRERRLEQIWRSFIFRTVPLEENFEKKTKRVFYDMRKRILGKLYGEDKSIKLEGEELVPADFDSWLREYNFPHERDMLEKYSQPYYLMAVEEGFKAFVEENALSISFDLADPAVSHFLSVKPLKLSGKYLDELGPLDTILAQVRKATQEGAEQGLTINQIAEKIRIVFNHSANNAKTIARTEVVGASNFGRHAGLIGSGFAYKEWFTSLDERVRKDHVDMHGKVIKVEEVWIVDGSPLQYPGDWNGAAGQVINCRCIEVASEGPTESE